MRNVGTLGINNNHLKYNVRSRIRPIVYWSSFYYTPRGGFPAFQELQETTEVAQCERNLAVLIFFEKRYNSFI